MAFRGARASRADKRAVDMGVVRILLFTPCLFFRATAFSSSCKRRHKMDAFLQIFFFLTERRPFCLLVFQRKVWKENKKKKHHLLPSSVSFDANAVRQRENSVTVRYGKESPAHVFKDSRRVALAIHSAPRESRDGPAPAADATTKRSCAPVASAPTLADARFPFAVARFEFFIAGPFCFFFCFVFHDL